MNVRADRAQGRRQNHQLVWRRHGSHAVLPVRRRHPPLPHHLQARARSVRRRRACALQSAGATSTSFLNTATSRAASAASFFDDLSEGGAGALLRAHSGRRQRLSSTPICRSSNGAEHALRRTRTRLPGLPARTLRRVQSWSGIAARCSACSRAGAPNRSSCRFRPSSNGATTGSRNRQPGGGTTKR